MLRLKVDLNYGPVTSGVVGTRKLYDIWGNTVNVASHMESTGVSGKIHLPVHVSNIPPLSNYFKIVCRGKIPVKSKGVMDTACVIGQRFATILEDSNTRRIL